MRIQRPEPRSATTKVIVLTPGIGGKGGVSRLFDGVAADLAASEASRVEVNYITTRGATKVLQPSTLLIALFQIARARAAGRCDVLHVNLSSNASTYRKLVVTGFARLLRIPYVIHLHSGEYPQFYKSQPAWMRRLIDKLYHRASLIIVLGDVWQTFVRETFVGTVDRITVLPNATRSPPQQSERPRAGQVTIIFLGQLTVEKGVPDLAAAFGLMANVPGWKAVLAGEGNIQQTRESLEAYGVADRVETPGWLDGERVDQLWREADIFVLPSLCENMPLSIVEAFAYGVPVVCTAVGAVPEMVEHERTGLIVPRRSSRALADALTRLVNDPNLRQSLGEAGKQTYAVRYDMSVFTGRLVDLWKSVASRNSQRDVASGKVVAELHDRQR